MNRSLIKRIVRIVGLVLILAIAFRWAGGDELRYKQIEVPSVEFNNVLPEITEDSSVEQEFVSTSQRLEELALTVSCYGRSTNKGNIFLEILDKVTGEVLAKTTIDVSDIDTDQVLNWELNEPIEDADQREMKLRVTSNSKAGSAISLYFFQDDIIRTETLYLNNEAIGGILCYSIKGKTSYWFGDNYWYIVTVLLSCIVLYQIILFVLSQNGKDTLGIRIYKTWKKYEFLIKQLVSRDFKTKYKRSFLGYLWSLLNPLLSMGVQYIVFSTIFRQDVENFPVYLLSGIIMFNFFVDAVGQGLNAILCNASLITKVYVPKYIYPVTKVISCSINLFISLIPLYIVMIITKEELTKALLLIIFPLVWVLVFCIGMALALSSAMVFFRDTQYLWGILSLAWTYATPLFYPARIIPEQFSFILKINPMYHYISFFRELLIAGKSPDLYQYILCSITSAIMLAVGLVIFKKTQDKFILYI